MSRRFLKWTPLATLAALLWAGGSQAAEAAAPDGRNEIRKFIRIVEDIGPLVTVLQEPGKAATLTAISTTPKSVTAYSGGYYDIDTQKFDRSPEVKAGTYSTGTLTILDLRDPDKVLSKSDWDVELLEASPKSAEDSRVFSPYLTAPSLALAELPQGLNEKMITRYPRTFVIPDAWFASVASIVSDPALILKMASQPDATGLGVAAYAQSRLASLSLAECLELMDQGDRFSKAFLVAAALAANPSVDGMLKEKVLGAKSRDLVDGITLGLLVSLRTAPPREDGDPLLAALRAYYGKDSGNAQSAAFLKYLDRLDSASPRRSEE